MLFRIFIFIVINLAVVVLLTAITSIFGIDTNYLQPNGLNLESLFIVALIIGFAGSFISLFLSKWIAKKTMGIELITQPKNHQESRIVEIISGIAHRNNIKTPEIGIYHSSEVNAFATGSSRNNSLVAVSAGLLEEMNEQELEGVLAHEMAHVINGDMVTMALLQGVINTFVIFFARIAAYAVQKTLLKDDEEVGGIVYFLISIAFEIVFGILASLIVFWVSRRREFAADKGAAVFVGKNKMIAALQKLNKLSNRIDTSQKTLATMKISDRGSSIFSTHPDLQLRIQRLQELQIG